MSDPNAFDRVVAAQYMTPTRPDPPKYTPTSEPMRAPPMDIKDKWKAYQAHVAGCTQHADIRLDRDMPQARDSLHDMREAQIAAGMPRASMTPPTRLLLALECVRVFDLARGVELQDDPNVQGMFRTALRLADLLMDTSREIRGVPMEEPE